MVYSKERRREVLAACDAGGGTREVATRFGVSESWVRRIKQERRELGKTAPKLTRDRKPKWHPIADDIQRVKREQPDLTLSELKAELGTELSEATLCRALQTLKLTLKKSPDRVGTGPPGRRRSTRFVAAHLGQLGSFTPGVPPRNVGENQHDASAWPGTSW